MSITKPYTFQPNTKARANEVNANFDTLYSQVNTNISNIEANARDIDELNDTKAELNGDSTQRFAVADPVNDTDAINKQTMLGQLSPTIDYIGGLTISKDSNSPNDTIIVDSGSCYDSTKKVVLSLANSTSKKNATQAASTTYYVHIVGNSTGSSTDIIISPDSISPTLPSGYTLYRLIGYYTTNGSGNILSIVSNSNSDNYSYIINNIAPNYSKATSFNPSNGGAVNFNGWISVNSYTNPNDQSFYVSVNGLRVFAIRGGSQNGYPDDSTSMFIVTAGDVLSYSGNAAHTFYKIPFKGDK